MTSGGYIEGLATHVRAEGQGGNFEQTAKCHGRGGICGNGGITPWVGTFRGGILGHSIQAAECVICVEV